MGTKQESVLKLTNALEFHMDAYLEEYLFRRSRKSLVYTRRMADSVQKIDLITHYNPRYAPGVDIHINPFVKILMPSLGKIALQLVGGNRLMLANAPDIVTSQPMEIAAPKEYRVRWLASTEEECMNAVIEIEAFIDKWVIKFLDTYNSIQSVIMAYETNDERWLRQNQLYIYVVAAYIFMNRLKDAKNAAEAKFGLPGQRREYSALFNYLDRE